MSNKFTPKQCALIDFKEKNLCYQDNFKLITTVYKIKGEN